MKDRCAPDKKTRKELIERVVGALQYSSREIIAKYNSATVSLGEVFDRIGFRFGKKMLYTVIGKGKSKTKKPVRVPTFIDDEGKELPISYLMSKKELRVYDSISDEDANILNANANRLVQAFAELDKRFGVESVKKLMDRWFEACDKRIDFIKEYGNMMSELNGVYKSKVDPHAEYFITNDPLYTILKSTGRTWEYKNCERIYGGSQKGIDSDIEHNSAIAYLMDNRKKGFDSAVARLELKMCEFDPEATETKERYSVGWEINWYRGKDSHKRHHVFRKDPMSPLDITAEQATKELIAIIKSKGFFMDYETCTTPFVHEGFSDIEFSVDKHVRFQSVWKYRCRRCGTPVRDSIGINPNWNKVCPYHNAHPEARDVVRDDDPDDY